MVWAFLIHSLPPSDCAIYFSQTFSSVKFGGGGEAQEPRVKWKLALLRIADRIRVECESQRRFANSSFEKEYELWRRTDGPAVGEGFPSGLFVYPTGIEPFFEQQQSVVWQGGLFCGFALVCSEDENRVLADATLKLLVKYLEDGVKAASSPRELMAKPDVASKIVNKFLPNGQMLFMTHQIVRHLEKELGM